MERVIFDDFRACFGGLAAIGRDPATGAWQRLAWCDEARAARAWFAEQAAARGLDHRRDANGNLWAWWGDPEAGGALVLGSHLDTVRQGGAYDGALGVVGGFVALAALRRRGVTPSRPVTVAAFAEEEGSRFGLPTLGSRLLAGTLDPADALDRRDGDGVSLAEAMRADGLDPRRAGHDRALLGRLWAVLELHVEQGRALADLPAPLAVASRIWPHGRWRLELVGETNHAGTTPLEQRRDPTLPLARAIEAARELAGAAGAVATVGRILVDPNGSNSVPGRVEAWLDARAPDDASLEQVVAGFETAVASAAARQRVSATVTCESRSAAVEFDVRLRGCLEGVLRRQGLPAPRLPTAAGHDAGALAAVLPAAMLFVRNPSGASHCPAESASDDDCVAGCAALAAAVEELACR
jgi:beta-ureidopropionase / N-carbamoyl-L-amino-acid hydrolase